MSKVFAPIPLQDAIATVQGSPANLTTPWVNYLSDVSTRLGNAPERVGIVSLTAQAASIAATDIPIQTLTTGVYRITYFARITTPGTVSSSLTITFSWPDDAVTVSASGSAITGNTTATFQSGTFVASVDAAGPITYATTYASVGATPMQYKLIVLAEAVAV